LLKHFTSVKYQSHASKLLFIFIVIATLAPVISNNKPLFIYSSKTIDFPAFYDFFKLSPKANTNNIYTGDIIVYPILKYVPKQVDLANANYVSPFSSQNVSSTAYRHWLGTDLLGHDVLAGIIYGSRTALLVGIFSMLVSFLIGTLLGSVSGYWADDKIKINKLEIFLLLIIPLFIYYYGFISLKYRWIYAWQQGAKSFFMLMLEFITYLLLILATFWTIFKIERKLLSNRLKRNYYLPLDFIITRFLEVFELIPVMFLIISLIAIVKPSVTYVIVIIGLISWPPITRYTRAEFLRIRKLEFVEAAQALGYSNFRIIVFHIFPNAINSILIALTFGVANAILAESALSFLGVGLSVDEVTWGSLLAGARQSPEAWWLVVFPGGMLFFMVWALNNLGEHFMKKLNKRSV